MTGIEVLYPSSGDSAVALIETTVKERQHISDIIKIPTQTGEPVNTLISRKRYVVLYLRERLQFIYDELINF